MEMVRRITSEDHADKWLFFRMNSANQGFGVELGPIFCKRIIKRWETEGQVIGHRVRGNFEEWFIL